MVWYGRTMHERARSTQSSMSAMRQYLHEGTSQTATEPRKGILNTNNTIMTNDMTWRRTWFQLQQRTAATSAKTWLIRWIPCPCFDPYPTTFGLPILGHLEHGRVYFITAPSLKGTRTLLVSNEAVTAHQQQHRHNDNNISIITPLHLESCFWWFCSWYRWWKYGYFSRKQEEREESEKAAHEMDIW